MPRLFHRENAQYDGIVTVLEKTIAKGNFDEFCRVIFSKFAGRYVVVYWHLLISPTINGYKVVFTPIPYNNPYRTRSFNLVIRRDDFDKDKFFNYMGVKLDDAKFPLEVKFYVGDHYIVSDGTDGHYTVPVRSGAISYTANKSLDEAKTSYREKMKG